jgi:hypothetical protein
MMVSNSAMRVREVHIGTSNLALLNPGSANPLAGDEEPEQERGWAQTIG